MYILDYAWVRLVGQTLIWNKLGGAQGNVSPQHQIRKQHTACDLSEFLELQVTDFLCKSVGATHNSSMQQMKMHFYVLLESTLNDDRW